MVGCSPSTTETSEERQSEEKAPAVEQVENPKLKETLDSPKEDGTVISFEQVKAASIDPDLDAYQMMYWSEGIETAAYVTIPKKKGHYFLGVICHGGYVIPLDFEGIQSIDEENLDAESMLSEMSSEVITLQPLYRGYGESKGTAPGLYGATIDTNNAIEALYAYFKEGNMESSVRSGFISLSGGSLGGGVVLKLSQMRKDIDNVVAINPYVGLDLAYPWADNHPENDWNKGFLETYHKEFGDYDPASIQAKEESIELKRSFTPILIVQGQKDEVMNWELTQKFYEKLKKENQNEHTILEFIPDGEHYLVENENELNQIIDNWYREIGSM